MFLLLMGKAVLSQNFMMNCVSPDFKSMAFYKYNESKNALFVLVPTVGRIVTDLSP